MKIKSAKVVKRVVNTSIVPVNAGISLVNLAMRLSPAIWTLAKFASSRPKWLYGTWMSTRRIGVYEFTDRKGRVISLLLAEDQARQAIENADNNGARQFVLDELSFVVATTDRCPNFEVPSAIYLWSHPSKGIKVRRVRSAGIAERKQFGRPIREGIYGILRVVARS